MPKINALKTALLLSSDPWEKNATVIGIIGKTHGVRTPANPASKEIRKNFNNPLSDLTGVISELLVLLAEIDLPSVFSAILIEKSTSFGGEHVELLQAIKLTVPLTLKVDSNAVIFCLNSAFVLNVFILKPKLYPSQIII